MLRNCWARELGQAEMAVGEEESSEGMKVLKSWKMLEGAWKVFLREEGSKRDMVSWRSLLNTAWVADSLLMDAPT